MSKWPTETEWSDITQINDGNEYAANDGVTTADFNTIIKNLFYLKDKEFKINGTIREYMVNNGATVNVGDFVEFISKFGSGEFSNSPSNNVIACKLDNDRVFIAYVDIKNSYLGTALILKITDTSVIVGEPYVFTNAKATYISADAFDGTRVCIGYGMQSDDYNVFCKILIIDDCNIVAEGPYYSHIVYTAYTYTSLIVLSKTLVMLGCNEDYTSRHGSGSTVHIASACLLSIDDENNIRRVVYTRIDNTGGYPYSYVMPSLFKLSENKVVAAYVCSDNLYARILTYTDTKVIGGSTYTIDTYSNDRPVSISRKSNGNVLFAGNGYIFGAVITGDVIDVFRRQPFSTSYGIGMAVTGVDRILTVVATAKNCTINLSIVSDAVYDLLDTITISDILLKPDTEIISLVTLSEDKFLLVANNGNGIYREITIQDDKLFVSDDKVSTGVYIQPATSNLHNVGVARTSGTEGETVEVYCVN